MHTDDIHFEDHYDVEWKYVDISVVLEPCEGKGGLYLGNSRISQDLPFLKDNAIPIILDVCGQKFVYPEDIIHCSKSIAAQDFESYDLSQHFTECFDFIHEHRLNGHNVLVHCMAGVSRSATIVIGYLMKTCGMDLENAYKFVRKRRTCISPNEGFIQQLEVYEKELLSLEKASQPKQS